MWLKKNVDTVKALLKKYREIVMYLIFGGLAAAVSALSYFVASWGFGLSAWLSSIVSWIFAVTFAFITNKIFVFQSKNKTKEDALKEALLFFAMRLSSLALNVIIMLVFVDWMNLHEPLIFLVAQFVVLVFNYVASKFWVFREEKS